MMLERGGRGAFPRFRSLRSPSASRQASGRPTFECYDKRLVRPTALSPWLFVPALLSALLATGCLHETDTDLEAVSPLAESSAAEPVVRRDVTVAWQGKEAGEGAESPVSPVLSASPSDRPPPDPIPFRIGAGHGALGNIDLAPCRGQGLQSGYLRMRVTFRRDGRVVHAAVESPAPPPDEALSCIAERLEAASVPVFDGRDASLTRRFFVEPRDAEDEPGDTVVRKGGAPPRRKGDDGTGLSQR
jgi:hypothetical protein